MAIEKLHTLLPILEENIRSYIESRRKRVDEFVDRNFALQGNLKIQSRCIRQDLIRNPVNALLAVPGLTVRKSMFYLERLTGWEKVEKLSPYVTALTSIKTDYQREVESLIRTELLESDSFFSQLELSSEVMVRVKSGFHKKVKDQIKEFISERATTTDLVASVLPLAVGYSFFKEPIYSASDLGSRAAHLFARREAEKSFFLGSDFGSAFYDIFPAAVAPTDDQVAVATGLAIVGISILAWFTSVLSDPLQYKLGVHKRKLYKMLDELEVKLLIWANKELRHSH
jgi:hypothetical protein